MFTRTLMLRRSLKAAAKCHTRYSAVLTMPRYFSESVDKSVKQAKLEAEQMHSLNVSTAQSAVVIAIAGAAAYAFMSKNINIQDIDDFNSGTPASADSMSPDEFRKFKLREIIDVNHNTKIYRFNLALLNQKLDHPCASFVLIRAPIGEEGETVVRPYTPISNPMKSYGHFDVMIKSYPNGKVSKYMTTLTPGDMVEFKGPINKIACTTNMKSKIGMIAGGSGITPMLQVIENSLADMEDRTEFNLVYANVEKEDILLRDKLKKLAHLYAKRLHVHFVLEKPPAQWNGSKGYVTDSIIKQHLPAPSDNSMIFVCGPPPMMAAISGDKAEDKSQGELKGILSELGYKSENVFKF